MEVERIRLSLNGVPHMVIANFDPKGLWWMDHLSMA